MLQKLNAKSWQRLGLFLCVPVLTLGLFGTAMPTKAAIGGKRAAVLMPFTGGGTTGFESVAGHTPYSTNHGFYTSWDIHGGASTAVYPRVATGDGNVEMKIVNVYNSSNGAGQGVDVEVKVAGVYVGKLRYAHLVNVGVTDEQSGITTTTRLGDTAPDAFVDDPNIDNTEEDMCKGFVCSDSWDVHSTAGIHTHMEFSKACYGPQSTRVDVSSGAGIALLSENYQTSNHSGCDTNELNTVAAGGVCSNTLCSVQEVSVGPSDNVSMYTPLNWSYRVKNTTNSAASIQRLVVAVRGPSGNALDVPCINGTGVTIQAGQEWTCTATLAQGYGQTGQYTFWADWLDYSQPGNWHHGQLGSDKTFNVGPATTLTAVQPISIGPSDYRPKLTPLNWSYRVKNTSGGWASIKKFVVAVRGPAGDALDVPCANGFNVTLAPGQEWTCEAYLSTGYGSTGTFTFWADWLDYSQPGNWHHGQLGANRTFRLY